MKALAALALCSLLACTPKATHPARQLQTEFHADTSFTADERQDLVDAARLWCTYTSERACIKVTFDVNDATYASHLMSGHQFVHRIDDNTPQSGLVDELTGSKPRLQALAATMRTSNGRAHVYIIPQRIDTSHFYSIALHEFGHVLGFPDLDTRGSIMSGEHREAINLPSFADTQLCKDAGYCE